MKTYYTEMSSLVGSDMLRSPELHEPLAVNAVVDVNAVSIGKMLVCVSSLSIENHAFRIKFDDWVGEEDTVVIGGGNQVELDRPVDGWLHVDGAACRPYC